MISSDESRQASPGRGVLSALSIFPDHYFVESVADFEHSQVSCSGLVWHTASCSHCLLTDCRVFILPGRTYWSSSGTL